ncbi:MAG: hypothetical protein JWM05_500 [Acidimicrobiales bacterium]|nr:hypothetical protein [Acidimicrobiales bacterium]
MTIALVDDQGLGAVLRGSAPRPLRRRQLATTGLWYVRLCQAALASRSRAGVLSLPFADLPADLRSQARAALLELPAEIELLSLRRLGPVIGRLRERHRLNLLGMEALAAAITLGADVYLSAPSPRLQAALTAEGCRFRHLA